MTNQEIALRETVEGTIAQLRDPAFEQQIQVLLPETTSAKKFLRVAATAALEKPELATADRASLIRALLHCAELGLMPNGREAALVTFYDKKEQIEKVTLMPMIEGIRKYVAEFGWSLRTDVIYENDDFEDHTAEGYVHHIKPRPGTDRGTVQGAYAFAIHKDGRHEALVYSEAEIQEIRKKYARSQNVWNDRPDTMREKTCGHRLVKKLPLDPKDRERLDRVLSASDPVDELYGPDDSAGERAASLPEPRGLARPGDGGAPVAQAPPLGARSEGPTASSVPVAASGEGQQAGTQEQAGVPAPGSDERAWEGQEPAPQPEASAVEEPRFEKGRFAGKTISEVLESGKDGESYIAWARSNWRTSPMREALDGLEQS